MVERRTTDGRRIAQLLASEVTGRTDGPLGALVVADARDVEGSTAGEFAYGIDRATCDASRVADVYVHEDRVRVEVRAGVENAVAAAEEQALRVRPTATDPPRAVMFVESGAEVKRACDALATATAVGQG